MAFIPENYNIAIDCLVEKAKNPQTLNRTAMAFVNDLSRPGQGIRLSYQLLDCYSNRAANAFSQLELERLSPVLIRLGNVPEFPLAFFGAIKAGLLPLPIPTELTSSEISELVNKTQAQILISIGDNNLKNLFEESNIALKHCWIPWDSSTPVPKRSERFQDLLLNQSEEFKIAKNHKNDPAYALYTSGTSGQSRVVIHAHRSIPAHDDRVALWQGFQPGDIVYSTSNLNWSYALTSGMMDILRHAGTSLFYHQAPTPEQLVQLINQYDVTTLMSVPTHYRRLVRHLKSESTNLSPFLRDALSAGEKLDPVLKKEFFQQTSLKIREGLGMSESSVYTVQQINKNYPEPSIGQLLHPKQHRIFNGKKSTNGTSIIGELSNHQNDPNLMLGYGSWAKNKLDLKLPLQEDWFLTGDLVKIDENQNIYYISRKDDMLNSMGHKLSPLEIEQVLNESKDVLESAATSCSKEGKFLIIVYIVPTDLKASVSKLEQSLRQLCQDRLASYKHPHQYVFVESLPKSRTGKIKRQELTLNLKIKD